MQAGQEQVALSESGEIFLGSVKVKKNDRTITLIAMELSIKWFLDISMNLQTSHHYQKGQPISIHGCMMK